MTRAAFGVIAAWYRMPRALAPIGDRVVWKAVKDEKLTRSHHCLPTVNYRTKYIEHYTYFRQPPPPGATHVRIKTNAKGDYVDAEVLVGPRRALLVGAGPKSTDVLGTGGEACAQPDSSVRPVSPTCEGRTSRVSLCMIVKDEEANLAACLGPVAGLFDEIIVVDTGSTDQTRECAPAESGPRLSISPGRIASRPRNESMRHATGDWIFWLDGDDRLDEPNLEKLRRLLAELPEENNAYMMCQRSTPDQATGACLVVDQARLFRNLPEARWSYRVHEQIFVALKQLDAREKQTDIVIHHLGYQETNARKRKRERNVRLLQMELDERPNDGFILFNLANAYMDAALVEEALGYMRRTLVHAPRGASYLAKVYFMLAGGCHILGRDEEALEHCREGRKRFPQSADIWFQEGILHLAQDDLPGARHCFETILKLPSQGTYVGLDPDLPGSRTRHNLAFVCRRLGLRQQSEEQWLLAIEQTPRFEPALAGAGGALP